MPQLIEVPNYGQVEFPDDMSDADITKAIKKTALGYKEPKGKAYEFSAPSLSNLKENASTFGSGLLSGAADIGDTLINGAVGAGEYAKNKLTGSNQRSGVAQWNDNRTNQLADIQSEGNQDPLYAIGRLGGNIAGTAGVGGAAGGALKLASKTPQAAAFADAIASGGLTGTNAVNRLGGGAVQGALGSLLIDPESTKSGAAIGAAFPIAGQVAKTIGGGVADVVGNLGTHTGGQGLKTAAQAGMEGGQTARTFADNMRGNVPMTDVINMAEQNLSNMGQQASQAYRSGMAQVSKDRAILDFNGIDKSLNNAFNKITYKGQVKNAKGAEVFQKINDEIAQWKALEPAEFHTPEGLDALKQKIGGIVESIPFEEKTARLVGNDVYHSIKNEITNQAPTYAKVMKDYSQGMDELTDIRKTLSLGGKATNDTKLRKLQSIMRNNVNTNYGQRADLVNTLQNKGGLDLNAALAGQSLNNITPRGLGNIAAGGTALASIANPMYIPALLAQSPRLMGEAALKVGQGAGLLSNGAKSISPLIPAFNGYLNQN